jgi:hypothetical protein
MYFIRMTSLVITTALVAGACADQRTPTETTPAVTPGYKVSDAPFQSGLHVERGAVYVEFFLFIDASAGLAVGLHSDSDGFPACGEEEGTDFSLLDVMFHGSRDDPDLPGLLTQALFQGELFATVFSLEGEITDLCDFLVNGTRIAEGTVRVMLTDNDFAAFLRSMPIRADAFGTMARGTVTLTSGGSATLKVTDRVVFFPPDDVREQTRITLTPD